MINRRNRFRAGYSMIEAVVMVSVFSMVMTPTLSWIHLSMKFSQTVKNRAVVHGQMIRLSSELRANISRSDNAKVDGKTLILNIDSKATRYTINDGVIERSSEAAATDGREVLKRETFRIGDDVDARWSAEELPDWVSLTIRQKPMMSGSDDPSTSISSLETPKLEFHLRAAPQKGGQ